MNIIDHEAQIARTRRGMNGFGLELVAGFVQIDFLGTEFKRGTPAGNCLALKSEPLFIEGTCALDGCDRQNQMIEPRNCHLILRDGQIERSPEQKIGTVPKKSAELTILIGALPRTGL